MSGGEALAGIGILCNAMQIVTFGKDAFEVYNHIRQNGTADPGLKSYLIDASKSYDEMKKRLSTHFPLTSCQQEIVDIGEEAHRRLQKFGTYFEELYVDPASRKGFRGKLRVARSGVKTLMHGKDLEDLEKNFERYQRLFQTGLIQRVCSQADATALLAQKSYQHLDITQQSMVKKIAEGYTEMSLLISQKAVELKSHVTNQHEETRMAIAGRNEVKDKSKIYGQLMASLRYPEMNSRKNQVIDNFPKTFQWIFLNKGSKDGDLSSSESHNFEDDSDQEDPRDPTTSTPGVTEKPTVLTDWLSSNSNMFWISGKPGSGKSTLMKFIATSSRTKEHLDAWRPDVRILTHYFWKAGTPMERSLKGLLLSFTYQILLDESALAQRLWEAMPDIRHKWSHSDWDPQHLESAMFWLLESAGTNFFLLMDGLDESEEFGTHLSMAARNQNVLNRLAELQGVKICVSSREEYIFVRHFKGVGQLRIHELTKHDIRRFADSRLRIMDFASRSDREDIRDLIVGTADGVFLWVTLVLNSVARAFRIDNNVERLIERIEQMPRDLIELVGDMWKRSGEDADVPSYRVSASRYFNLALAANATFAASIIPLAVASQERSVEDILDVDRTWDSTELANICSRTVKEVAVVCSGLLEFGDADGKVILIPESLQSYWRSWFKFPHRCVVDFLQDTEDGTALLDASEWPQGEAIARLVGSTMVISRSRNSSDSTSEIYHEPGIPLYDDVIDKKKYVFLMEHPDKYFDTVVSGIADLTISSPYRGLFLRKSHEWYMAGLFHDHYIWKYSGHSIFRDDPLKNQFLTSLAKAASLSMMERLIAALPTDEFLNALPAIFRGLSTDFDDLNRDSEEYIDIPRLKRFLLKRSGLTEQILSRLLELQEDDSKGIMLQKPFTGEMREDLQRLVCSWYLGSINTIHYEQFDDTIRRSDLAVLQLIQLALPRLEDWDQPVLLSLKSDNKGIQGFMYFENRNHMDLDEFYIVVNLVTAYQIFLQFLQRNRVTPQTTQGMSITNEQLPHIASETELSLRIVTLKSDIGGFASCATEEQHQDSELLLNSLLTGQCLTADEIASIKAESRWVNENYRNLASYLITELGHIPGLPMHPWTAWLVFDVSEHDGAEEDLHAQVDEKSRESLRKVIEEISKVL